ncbi:TolC family protein [Spirosoma telluris]
MRSPMFSRSLILLPLLIIRNLLAQPAPSDSTLTLAKALELATQNYPSIKNKLAETEATKADLAARKASFLPSATFQAQALYATSNNVRGPPSPMKALPTRCQAGLKPMARPPMQSGVA